MKILYADENDISELYQLQLLSFESEAEMIGSRDVPALLETKEDNEKDFGNWNVLKLVNDANEIIGAIRYKKDGEIIEVGRLMVHPEYRRQGLAQELLAQVDQVCQNETKELFTCKKSWTNIRLYEKMGYKCFKECTVESGLPMVYMRKE